MYLRISLTLYISRYLYIYFNAASLHLFLYLSISLTLHISLYVSVSLHLDREYILRLILLFPSSRNVFIAKNEPQVVE